MRIVVTRVQTVPDRNAPAQPDAQPNHPSSSTRHQVSGCDTIIGTHTLRDCTLGIPEGRVVGLVGPNGAGKTTLLSLATGLLAPTCGTVSVLGERPAAGPAQLARVGFVAQDTLKGPTIRSSY